MVRDDANPPAFDRVHLLRDEALDNLSKPPTGRIDLILIDKGVAFHLLKTQMPEALQTSGDLARLLKRSIQ